VRALGRAQVPEQVERVGPQAVLGRGVQQAAQSVVREQADEVVEAGVLAEQDGDPQERRVVDDAERGDERRVVELADVPGHRDRVVARRQLARDGQREADRDGGEHGPGSARVEFGRELGEERGVEALGDRHRALGGEQPGDPRAQQRAERARARSGRRAGPGDGRRRRRSAAAAGGRRRTAGR
jgi:hypothetical protein